MDSLDLELPKIQDEAWLLMESTPTFQQQIAHARMILSFQKNPNNHPPRQSEEFVF
jgi:hypothetical protein